jgi:hypothetical protein
LSKNKWLLLCLFSFFVQLAVPLTIACRVALALLTQVTLVICNASHCGFNNAKGWPRLYPSLSAQCCAYWLLQRGKKGENMRKLPAVLALLLFSAYALANDSAAQDKAIAALIDQLRDADASEYRDARKLFPIKLKHQDMVAVLFTLEGFGGGNNYGYYLSLFKPAIKYDKNDTPLAITKYQLLAFAKVGGQAWRGVEFDSLKVEGDLIALQVKDYQRNEKGHLIEVLCCPSVAATAYYKLEQAGLIEQ